MEGIELVVRKYSEQVCKALNKSPTLPESMIDICSLCLMHGGDVRVVLDETCRLLGPETERSFSAFLLLCTVLTCATFEMEHNHAIAMELEKN